MCIVSTEKPELQIAERDITVYKCTHKMKTVRYGLFKLKKKIFINSLIYDFVYRQDKVYETKLDEFEPHTSIRLNRYMSGRGFYSWKTSKYANVKCIIPKGAKYYCVYNSVENRIVYISDKIKVVEVC